MSAGALLPDPTGGTYSAPLDFLTGLLKGVASPQDGMKWKNREGLGDGLGGKMWGEWEGQGNGRAEKEERRRGKGLG